LHLITREKHRKRSQKADEDEEEDKEPEARKMMKMKNKQERKRRITKRDARCFSTVVVFDPNQTGDFRFVTPSGRRRIIEKTLSIQF
jgi:hypothetical protein